MKLIAAEDPTTETACDFDLSRAILYRRTPTAACRYS